MSAAEIFFDSNVLLYLLSGDAAKADRAEHLLAGRGVISVQVLNEVAAVAAGKFAMEIAGGPRGDTRGVQCQTAGR